MLLVAMLLSGLVSGFIAWFFSLSGRYWVGRYSAKRRLSVWVLLALAAIVPYSLFTSFAPVRVELSHPTVVVETNQRVTGKPVETRPIKEGVHWEEIYTGDTEQIGTIGYRLDIYNILTVVWFGGCGVILLFQVLKYIHWRRKTLRWNEVVNDEKLMAIIRQAKEKTGCERPVKTAVNPRLFSPLVVGLFRPMLLLPENLPANRQSEMILRHEFCHIKSLDVGKKLLLVFTNAIHWFNPLIYLLVRRAGQDIELACDERVLAGEDDEYRYQYGKTLLEYVKLERTNNHLAFSASFSDTRSSMKKRLENILDGKNRKKGIAILAGVLALVLLVLSLILIEPANRQTAVVVGEDIGTPGKIVMTSSAGEYSVATPFDIQAGGGDVRHLYAVASVGNFLSVINPVEDIEDAYIAVYTSQNRGRSWVKTSIDVLNQIDALGSCFHGYLNKEDGYLFVTGSQGSLTRSGIFLYRTRDAGRTWLPVRFIGGAATSFLDAGFINGKIGFMCRQAADEGFGLLMTADGGNAWLEADLAQMGILPDGPGAYTFISCDFTSGITILLRHNDSSAVYTAASQDGYNWQWEKE